MRRLPVADVRLEHEGLDALVADRRVAAGVFRQVGDARHLEPDEVVRVVRDALRVGLGEPDRTSVLKRNPSTRRTLRRWEGVELGYAAARLMVFSSRRRLQLEQTLRSTWYGTPWRCRSA